LNPTLQLPLLIPVLAAVLLAAAWLSWRATSALPRSRRVLFLSLRVLGIAALSALLLNPGKWIRPSDETPSPWLILLDRSASMTQQTGTETRAAKSLSLTEKAVLTSKQNQIPLRIQPFSIAPENPTESPASLPTPAGAGTDIHSTLKRLLDEAAASGESFAGILALSDGRQTATPTTADLAALSLRLRSRSIPFHSIAIGAETPAQDLVLRASRPTVTVFKGQKARVPFLVQSINLPPQKSDVRLLNEAGTEIATTSLEIPSGKSITGFFEIDASEASSRFTLETAVLPNESIPGNNRAAVNLRVLKSKTRVFLAEGAPYWDSKFLAQLLRQQTQMDIQSVHRLSEERYFRIDTGSDETSETSTAIFPETLDELSRYDLIVFGKNIDAFLTPARLEALRSYVRDRGGAVLFARGKPVTGNLPGLDSLEPVSWATASTSEFRFRPAPDGEAAGLFGEALPAPDSSVWNLLPPLKDARQISLVKPFTRVLADGVPDGSNAASARFPALLVRRYGQGVTGLVNGDGLWKWDFYPEARELGNMYEDFWIQLIQWMASYSEFLPGQDFSLRLPSIRGVAGESVTTSISFRGNEAPPTPILRITSPTGNVTELQPAAFPDPGGHPNWRASFTPDSPGAWKLTIIDSRENPPPTPEVTFTVPEPLAESDNLSADPEFLASLATSTGGTLITEDTYDTFLKNAFTPAPPSARTAGAIWQPSWLKWPLALLIALPLAAEWYLRRRQGLS
jgi:hypothetical protein